MAEKYADAAQRTYDLVETKKLAWGYRTPPDAAQHNAPDDTRRTFRFRDWMYDHRYGWTAGDELVHPRPPMRLAPYLLGSFIARTKTRAEAKHNYIVVDLLRFPEKARVFVVVPTSILPAPLVKKILAGKTRKIAAGVEVVKDVRHFNTITAEKLKSAASKSFTVLELKSGHKAVLNNLNLPTEMVDLRFFYGIRTEYLRSKTHYEIDVLQLTDYQLMGRFTHLFEAYHPYDVPLIGDRRTGIVYRRSAGEVGEIPAMAIEYFDTYSRARAANIDPDPRSFGRHFTAKNISARLAQEVLAVFNDRELTPKKLVAMVKDNPYLNTAGVFVMPPEEGRGVDKPTAEQILAVRKKLGRKGFTDIKQIDKVKGIGPDTLSDIITSVLAMRKAPAKGKWEPDERINRLLA